MIVNGWNLYVSDVFEDQLGNAPASPRFKKQKARYISYNELFIFIVYL